MIAGSPRRLHAAFLGVYCLLGIAGGTLAFGFDDQHPSCSLGELWKLENKLAVAFFAIGLHGTRFPLGSVLAFLEGTALDGPTLRALETVSPLANAFLAAWLLDRLREGYRAQRISMRALLAGGFALVYLFGSLVVMQDRHKLLQRERERTLYMADQLEILKQAGRRAGVAFDARSLLSGRSPSLRQARCDARQARVGQRCFVLRYAAPSPARAAFLRKKYGSENVFVSMLSVTTGAKGRIVAIE